MHTTSVRNMISPSSGKEVANQFIITQYDKHGNATKEVFQSYNTVIAEKRHYNGLVLLESGNNCRYDWKASPTTSKYRNQFLNETTKETQAKIDAGIYKLADLNK